MYNNAPTQDRSKHKPVKLILDTDMGNDIDDALALAMIHSMEARNECKLAGVLLSKDNPYAPAMVDAINTFYHHGDIPIGMVQNGVTDFDGKFNKQVVEMTDDAGHPLFPTTHPLGAYPPAVTLLRQLLAEAQDRSVVVIPIGFSTNLDQLFDTPGDDISSLNGKDLFAQKVSHVVMMAGYFHENKNIENPKNGEEYNIVKDLTASTRFIADCPVPMFFTPWELGDAIKHPCRSILDDYAWTDAHPVVEGYKLYIQMPYDRPTYDLTAVLQAVRPDRDYFTLSKPGQVHVDAQGLTHFTPMPDGNHYLMSVDATQLEIVRQVQVELSSQPVMR